MKFVGMYGDIYRYFCVFLFRPDLGLKVFFLLLLKTIKLPVGMHWFKCIAYLCNDPAFMGLFSCFCEMLCDGKYSDAFTHSEGLLKLNLLQLLCKLELSQ